MNVVVLRIHDRCDADERIRVFGSRKSAVQAAVDEFVRFCQYVECVYPGDEELDALRRELEDTGGSDCYGRSYCLENCVVE